MWMPWAITQGIPMWMPWATTQGRPYHYLSSPIIRFKMASSTPSNATSF
jgi:hypothetical protein